MSRRMKFGPLVAATALAAALASTPALAGDSQAPVVGAPLTALNYAAANDTNPSAVLKRYTTRRGLFQRRVAAQRDLSVDTVGLPAPSMQARPRTGTFVEANLQQDARAVARERFKLGNYWSTGAFR